MTTSSVCERTILEIAKLLDCKKIEGSTILKNQPDIQLILVFLSKLYNPK